MTIDDQEIERISKEFKDCNTLLTGLFESLLSQALENRNMIHMLEEKLDWNENILKNKESENSYLRNKQNQKDEFDYASVIEVLFDVISGINNQILDSDDIDQIRDGVQGYIEYMISVLKTKGIDVFYQKRYSQPDETFVDKILRPTDDDKLDGTIASCDLGYQSNNGLLKHRGKISVFSCTETYAESPIIIRLMKENGEEKDVYTLPKGTIFTLPTADVLDDYIFQGWNVDGSVLSSGEKITVDHDIIISPQYDVRKYTLTIICVDFDRNQIAESCTHLLNRGAPLQYIELPSIDGYTLSQASIPKEMPDSDTEIQAIYLRCDNIVRYDSDMITVRSMAKDTLIESEKKFTKQNFRIYVKIHDDKNESLFVCSDINGVDLSIKANNIDDVLELRLSESKPLKIVNEKISNENIMIRPEKELIIDNESYHLELTNEDDEVIVSYKKNISMVKIQLNGIYHQKQQKKFNQDVFWFEKGSNIELDKPKARLDRGLIRVFDHWEPEPTIAEKNLTIEAKYKSFETMEDFVQYVLSGGTYTKNKIKTEYRLSDKMMGELDKTLEQMIEDSKVEKVGPSNKTEYRLI